MILVGCVFISSVAAISAKTAGEEFPTYRTGSDIQVCNMTKIEFVADAVEDNQPSVDACIVSGKDIDLAYPYGQQVNKGIPFVRLHETASGKFSKLSGLRNPPQMVAGTNTIFYAGATGLTIVNDITKALSIVDSSDDEVSIYSIDSSIYDKKILTENGVIGSFQVSKDGSFVAAYADDTGVVKYNMHTSEILALAMIDGHGKSTQNKPRVEVMSGDGRFIFMGPEGEIVDTSGCGDALAGRLSSLTLAHPCYRRYIGNITEDVGGAGSRTGGGIFSDDNYELRFSVQSEQNGKVAMRRVATAVPGVKQIAYLALGDSFSSGEGNLNTSGSGYRWGTDENGSKTTPREKCHLSEVSYPFLLANKMKYGSYAIDDSMNWSSIACSGAVIDDVSAKGSIGYEGQKQENNIPRLQGFDNSTLKVDALKTMIPGRQKQIEFVRRYQPKTVTVSIGGNDAQFGDIIKACVQPIGGRGTEWTSTCSYAKDDGKKANIAYTIFSLRNKLLDVYQQLLDAGPPGMKLYVIGYPVFIDKNPSNATCGLSVRLNNNEREMVVESTKLLNMMARSAADEAGAIFISTEDSFGQHVLCGSSSKKAVNGIVLSDTSASFHPNPYGHELMANRIQTAINGATLDMYICHDSFYVTCPGGSANPISMPNYFKNAINSHSRALNDQSIVDGFIRNLAKVPIVVGSYIYGANSPVSIIWYSEPQNIGTFQTNADGSLNMNVSLPADTPSGYHTLEISGTGADGQPLTLWKIVEVDNPNNPTKESEASTAREQHEGLNDNYKASEKTVSLSSNTPVRAQSLQDEESQKQLKNAASIGASGAKNSDARPSPSHQPIWLIPTVISFVALTGIFTIRLIIKKYKGLHT